VSAITAYAEELKAHIGVRGKPVDIEIEKGAIRKFARAIGETNPLYFDEAYAAKTRFGAIVAPPTFLAVLKAPLPDLPPPASKFSVHLHADDVIENSLPVKAGDVITSVAELTGVFEKSGRSGPMLFMTVTFHMTNQMGEPVATVAWTEVRCP
jgi:acyl dehydratase